MDKKQLSERDICTRFITPAIQQAGWQHHQFREEVNLTDGRVMVRGKLASRVKNPEAKGGPKPDDPVVPPEDTTPSAVGEQKLPPYIPGSADAGSTRLYGDSGSGGEGRTKYVINDVHVRVAVERSQHLNADGKLITEDYRVLLKGDIKKALQAEFGTMTGFLRRWNSTERKQAVLLELAEHGVPLTILQQAVTNGSELDVFDLVAHVAFDQKPLTSRERVSNVKKRDVFGRYGDQARAVLEVLLDKFADHGVQDIEDAKVLELPPFDQFGSKTQIRRGIFGSFDQYTQAIQELQKRFTKTKALDD